MESVEQVLQLTEEQALDRLEAMRWPEGVICPYCKSSNVRAKGKQGGVRPSYRYICHAEKKYRYFGLFTGTSFEHGRYRTATQILGALVGAKELGPDFSIADATALAKLLEVSPDALIVRIRAGWRERDPLFVCREIPRKVLGRADYAAWLLKQPKTPRPSQIAEAFAEYQDAERIIRDLVTLPKTTVAKLAEKI